MTTRLRTGARMMAAVALAALVSAGCAQPGQLGQPAQAPERGSATSAASAAAPLGPQEAAKALPSAGLLSSGLVEERVSMRSTGPAEFSVATEVLAPGESTTWHQHPGTEISLVRSGEVTVQQAEACEPVRYSAGDGVFVDDAEPHVVRNEGPGPAELVVTRLLAPGAPEKLDVEPAC